MDDIFVYVVGLPVGINELVLPCSDGYTVYINETLDDERKLKAYSHAMKHIRGNDWNKLDVQTIESDAHTKEEHNGIINKSSEGCEGKQIR